MYDDYAVLVCSGATVESMDTLEDCDIPADGYDGVAGDVLNHFNRLEGEELDLIVGIVGHRWLTGILQFQCKNVCR